MVMYTDLEGKTAVITGGDSGIGASIAARLGQEHMNVVINYHKNVDAANATKAIVEQGDISDEESANKLVQTAVDAFGGLDVFFNNAGMEKRCPTNEASLDDWNQVISVNLTGTFLGTKAALNY